MLQIYNLKFVKFARTIAALQLVKLANAVQDTMTAKKFFRRTTFLFKVTKIFRRDILAAK